MIAKGDRERGKSGNKHTWSNGIAIGQQIEAAAGGYHEVIFERRGDAGGA